MKMKLGSGKLGDVASNQPTSRYTKEVAPQGSRLGDPRTDVKGRAKRERKKQTTSYLGLWCILQ